MNASKLFYAAVVMVLGHCLAPLAMAQDVTFAPLNIGESVRFRSTVLKESRQLNVYLPQSYSYNSTQNYPVIYVLDGSMDEDFLHIAGLSQFASYPWIDMLPESIVVGIANVDRKRDFTATPNNSEDKRDFPTAGGSARFIQMLAEEIQPLIKQRYRSSGKRTLIGQSLGGLLATEILFKQPALFDNYIVISPSLWWNRHALLNSTLPMFSQPTAVFVGVGKEGDEMESLAKQLFEKLQAQSSKQPLQLKVSFQYFPKLDHGDALHMAVYAAFEQLFSSPPAAH
ncbi:alpha/beta hydrolase [Shewanella sp.]|uniref:alpha/beta hydrolase n=1 Tax=Shewanella sp. TaxID=50422 RepID=UPI003A973B2B